MPAQREWIQRTPALNGQIGSSSVRLAEQTRIASGASRP
jgi:hypothetical protein